MTKLLKGVFLSDIHMPDNIPLEPILKFIKDLKPDVIVLGGDIIDATGLHQSESMKAEQVDMGWYDRDVALIKDLVSKLPKVKKLVFLEGNHSERYRRLMNKYPKVFGGKFNFKRDALPKHTQYIPYGDYNAFYKLGDCIFTHGNVYPDAHAKKYSMDYSPYKVVYGHLHHFQAYTGRRASLSMSPRYAVTAGCLQNLTPSWKKGEAHQWVNGFISFVSDGKTTVPTVHLIENGRFYIGSKEYK